MKCPICHKRLNKTNKKIHPIIIEYECKNCKDNYYLLNVLFRKKLLKINKLDTFIENSKHLGIVPYTYGKQYYFYIPNKKLIPYLIEEYKRLLDRFMFIQVIK